MGSVRGGEALGLGDVSFLIEEAVKKAVFTSRCSFEEKNSYVIRNKS